MAALMMCLSEFTEFPTILHPGEAPSVFMAVRLQSILYTVHLGAINLVSVTIGTFIDLTSPALSLHF